MRGKSWTLVLLASAGVAMAQSAPEATPDEPAGGTMLDNALGDVLGDHPLDRGWTVRLEPAYWYAAPRGDVTIRGSEGPVSFEGGTFGDESDVDLFDLDADDPTGALLSRAHIANGRWRFTLGGTYLTEDGSSGPTEAGRIGDAFFVPGDRVETDFTFWTIEASAAYAILHGPLPGERGDPDRLRYALELLGGARVESIDFDLDVTPGAGSRPPELGLSASASDVFAQPIVGARLSLDLFREVTVEVGATVGYFGWTNTQTTTTWDVLAAISWRPVEHVGVEFGYRNLGLSAEGHESDLEFTGSAAGVFDGVVVEF
ncbi:MAG: hypothetical protein KDA05_04745 [Phycisphaerales bacterium]|nr:hypothetical protein [Phycisphaerales bacterium]